VNVDGTELEFVALEDGTLQVLAGPGRVEVGRLHPTEGATSFRAATPEGRFLQQPSPWGGPVTARFLTREIAARALLKELKDATP
jgi:hypothetical protein